LSLNWEDQNQVVWEDLHLMVEEDLEMETMTEEQHDEEPESATDFWGPISSW